VVKTTASTPTPTSTKTTPNSNATPSPGESTPEVTPLVQQAGLPSATIPVVRVLVLDKNGKPIEGAKVTLHSTPRVAYTGVDGYAIFRDVEVGDHHVVVAYRGQSQVKPLTIAESNADVVANVKLQKISASNDSWFRTPQFWILIVSLVLGYAWLIVYRRRKRQDEGKKP
jgi:hypothetical protein